MRKKIKTIVSVVLALLLCTTMVFADEQGLCSSEGCTDTHEHEVSESVGTEKDVWWEKEVVVVLENEEDFWTYPKNPNYKYTFIFEEPEMTRALCGECGNANLGVVYKLENNDVDVISCPVCSGCSYNDMFYEYRRYNRERCTSCGYQSSWWPTNIYTYTSYCNNGILPADGGEWPVSAEFTQDAGYDIHQYLYYWLYGWYD